MKQSIFKIKENIALTDSIFKMVLLGDTSDLRTGQFVNIKLDGFFLRRPISVCDVDKKSLTIIYKIVGEGTEQMSKMTAGEKLDLLTGLGNGYDLTLAGKKNLLVGGGVGIPPLYKLAKDLKGNCTVVLGFNTATEIFYEDEFKALGANVIITTIDGTKGVKGLATDVLKDIDYDYFFACGPEPMLKAVYEQTKTSGQLSFEERMGCGFGACMGCTCKTITGYKRICVEGPVLVKEELVW